MKSYMVPLTTTVYVAVQACSVADAAEAALEFINEDEMPEFDWSCNQMDIKLVSETSDG